MEIVVKKQYSLRNQPYSGLLGFSVGMVDSDHSNRSFYGQKMQEANLEVLLFPDLANLEKAIWGQPVSAVVYGINTGQFDREAKQLSRFVAKFPQLPVLTMSPTMQEMQLDAIMKIGSRVHINRDLTHPRDLLIALEQILLMK